MQRITAAAGFAVLLAGVSSAQYSSSPIASNFLDISATGTSLGLATIEDNGAALPIGFNFNFFGTTITSIAATTNGYLTTGVDLTDFTADCPSPDTLDPNGMIAPFFDDLSLVAHGEIYFQTIGTAPNRISIVQWEDSSTFDSSMASLTFQTQLWESNGDIQYHYASMTDPAGLFAVDGSTAFVGIEDAAGVTATVIGCATPGTLASNTSYQISTQLPYITAPATAIAGTVFNVPGASEPFHFYIYAWSLSAGPIGPIPLLEFQSLNLGLNFKLAGSGIASATGVTVSDNIMAPSGFGGTVVNWQMVTIGAFGPISNVGVSNPDTVTFVDGAVFTGSIPVAGMADSYSISLTAGDLITIRHCRTDNTGMNMSTLDCYLCLVDPAGVSEIINDDGAGDCYVAGPYGASEIIDHTVLMTGTYTIYATAYQGLVGGETGDYELTILGAGALSAALLADDGPLCPGQPFLNPAAKLLGQSSFQQQR